MVKKLVTFLVLSQLQTLTASYTTDSPAVNAESSEGGGTAYRREEKIMEQNPGINRSDWNQDKEIKNEALKDYRRNDDIFISTEAKF